MDPIWVVLLTLVSVGVLKGLALLVMTGGNFGRVMPAVRVFLAMLGDESVSTRALALLKTTKEPVKPVRLSSEPVRLLALLQREARLLDFLLEDIAGASDEQIGSAVRDIHQKSQQVLKEHLSVEPVLPGADDSPVEVPAGFDPSAVRLTGNVTGQPPFKGRLIHHGWRVKGYNLPKPAESQDDLVIYPAEVEL